MRRFGLRKPRASSPEIRGGPRRRARLRQRPRRLGGLPRGRGKQEREDQQQQELLMSELFVVVGGGLCVCVVSFFSFFQRRRSAPARSFF